MVSPVLPRAGDTDVPACANIPGGSAHLQPAPLEVPMLDLQAMILRSPTPQGVGMIPERSPSQLRLERPPVPLLARRSSPLERGAAVMNRPEPSLTVSMQVSCNLSMFPCLAATFTPRTRYLYLRPLSRHPRSCLCPSQLPTSITHI
jgi:hypothetical protein